MTERQIRIDQRDHPQQVHDDRIPEPRRLLKNDSILTSFIQDPARRNEQGEGDDDRP